MKRSPTKKHSAVTQLAFSQHWVGARLLAWRYCDADLKARALCVLAHIFVGIRLLVVERASFQFRYFCRICLTGIDLIQYQKYQHIKLSEKPCKPTDLPEQAVGHVLQKERRLNFLKAQKVRRFLRKNSRLMLGWFCRQKIPNVQMRSVFEKTAPKNYGFSSALRNFLSGIKNTDLPNVTLVYMSVQSAQFRFRFRFTLTLRIKHRCGSFPTR